MLTGRADETFSVHLWQAVQYAHSHLAVHRDFKPSNILIEEDGTPKLLDFGIAKQLINLDKPVNQTQNETGFTRAFAAPEQIRREPIGVYTDVYALGVILYELLAGRPPYNLAQCTPAEADNIIIGEREPEKPSAKAMGAGANQAAWNDLDVLCLKAMKKNVERRYASVVELMQDVDQYLNGEPLRARPDTLRYQAGKFLSRNRRVVVSTVLALALLVGVVVFFSLRLARERNVAFAEAARVRRVERFTLDLFEGGDEDAGPAENLRVVTLLAGGAGSKC